MFFLHGETGMPISELLSILGNTLVYLSIQTRNINRQSQAEARYAFVESMAEINMCIAHSKQASSVWRRGLEATAGLDDDERMQFFMFVGQYANCWAVMYQLHIDKMLPDAQWQIVRNDVVSILNTDGGQDFWESGGKTAFNRDFVDWIEAELIKGERPYDMAGMASVNRTLE
jgi:hypothetical protein